jgi:hypothetical protein
MRLEERDKMLGKAAAADDRNVEFLFDFFHNPLQKNKNGVFS